MNGLAGLVSQFRGSRSDFKYFDWRLLTSGTSYANLATFYGANNRELRTDISYHPTNALTVVDLNGRRYLKSYVDPNATPLPSGQTFEVHFRAEFTEHPWQIHLAAGTEEWLGFSYRFADNYVIPKTPISIFQYHTGSHTSSSSHSPQMQLEISNSGQTINGVTTQGGEIQVVNNCSDERYVIVPRVKPLAGQTLHVVMQTIFGDVSGSTAVWKVWLNGTLVHSTNDKKTIWTNEDPAVNQRGGNWKLGIYHHAQKTFAATALNEAVGHNDFTLYVSNVKRLRRLPGHPAYNTNAYPIVDTSFGEVNERVENNDPPEPPPLGPSTFTSGHTYVSGRDMFVYTPPGYYDSGNTTNYALIVYAHGYGGRGSNLNLLLTEGTPKYLNGGDEPSDVIIACPQYPGTGDWTLTDWDNVYTYMNNNYRVDTNRVTITGLSGGGFLCQKVAQSRTNQIAGTVMVSAGLGSGWVWSAQTEIAHFHIHGTNDGTVTNSLHSVLNNANAVTRTLPCHTLNLWNLGHTSGVWDTYCYNRKERTDAAGTATFDYIRYLRKQSKNIIQRATLYVENAEETLKIEDYREAYRMVKVLSGGTTRTNLENRLITLKGVIDGNGRRFLVDFGTTVSTGFTNHVSSTAVVGTTKSNLVDDNGNASTYSWIAVSDHSTTPTNRLQDGGVRSNGNYFGFQDGVHRDGIRVEGGSTGTSKFMGLNNSKAYRVRVYHTFTAGNNTDRSRLSIKIGNTTQSQDSELNNTQYMEFTGITPTSGEILITGYVSGTGTPLRNSQIIAYELFEYTP